MKPREETIAVGPTRVQAWIGGEGDPLLVLHGAGGNRGWLRWMDAVAERHTIYAPTHPGFGRSEAPKTFDTVDDLAYFYLDFLDQLDLADVVLVGVSFGGWIAAEMAIKSTARISHLVLGNAVGIKVGSREDRDIADIFAINEADFLELAYCNPDAGKRDYKAMPDAAVRHAARNREATARYAWSPYMHDPKLRGRLHRIRIPTLFLWGMHDRVLREDYGKAYCEAIPGACFERIERAGHFPHVEQASEFAEKIFAFVAAR